MRTASAPGQMRGAGRPITAGVGSRGSRRRKRLRSDRPGGSRRRLATLLVTALALGAAVELLAPILGGSLQRLILPLEDASTIRAQAAADHLDPALIAAVIYAETKFQPRTSTAGAIGLMQLEPATARFIATRSGGIDFKLSDLASADVNIAYGSWYLRYLLDHYAGREVATVAAYNAGLTNVDRWLANDRAGAGDLALSSIPFAETRAYVERVLWAQGAYRQSYARALGLR